MEARVTYFCAFVPAFLLKRAIETAAITAEGRPIIYLESISTVVNHSLLGPSLLKRKRTGISQRAAGDIRQFEPSRAMRG